MNTPSHNNLPKLINLIHYLDLFTFTIMDDYRSSYCDPDDETPAMNITLGWNPENGSWDIQTGDNSFTGKAYGYPYWATSILYKDSNPEEKALELISRLKNNYASNNS